MLLYTVKFKALKPLKDTAVIISCQYCLGIIASRLPLSSRPRHVLGGWRIPWQADREGGEKLGEGRKCVFPDSVPHFRFPYRRTTSKLFFFRRCYVLVFFLYAYVCNAPVTLLSCKHHHFYSEIVNLYELSTCHVHQVASLVDEWLNEDSTKPVIVLRFLGMS